ncbi:MAG: hypothetical protein KI790_05715 [Cyclobacteriaceae bacterium]|nr:hypothetical protein [Cyclobacteriaceae bacterium HetDA_MAG_MS6]
MRFLDYHKRKVAVFFIVATLAPLFSTHGAKASGVSASTAGPTSPEATSFEPVDATDMVNMLTGDFSYSIPLIEVPGPAGSYPIALSYHAGIMVKQEPSWVGLGWNLSPGAITRKVNGQADDFNGDIDTHESFWVGGTTRITNVGVSFPLDPTGTVSVTAGLQIAQDTYEGRSVGGTLGVAVSPIPFSGSSLGVSAQAGMGFGSQKGAYAGAGAGFAVDLGSASAGFSANVSASTNNGASAGMSMGISAKGDKPLSSSAQISLSTDKGLQASAGVSMKDSNVGVSLSTDGGLGYSFGKLSYSATSSSAHINKVQTTTDSWSFGFGGLSFGDTRIRYWIDNKEDVPIYGSLGVSEIHPMISRYDYETDVYSLYNPNMGIHGDDAAPIKNASGTFPDYDEYSVNAQGIGGRFQPYLAHKTLATPLKKEDLIVSNLTTTGPGAGGFRFVGDFSNSIRKKRLSELTSDLSLKYYLLLKKSYHVNLGYGSEDDEVDFIEVTKQEWDNRKSVSSPFYGGIKDEAVKYAWLWDGQPRITDSFFDGPGAGRYSPDNRITGSRHIEYYTNEQLRNNLAIVSSNCVVERTLENGFPAQQIGGFEITNKNGVTYHFMLPAYSRKEYVYSENTKQPGENNYEIHKAPYAYTWHLTAITGPDYVDRFNDGLDDGDFGYWVKFDYTKWSTENWRNPEYGFNNDIKNGVKYYTSGSTERYYLDKVSTASHIALFSKSQRPFDVGKAKLDGVYLLDKTTYLSLTQSQNVNVDAILRHKINHIIDLVTEKSLNTYTFEYGVFDSNDKRLRLDRLWNLGIGGADLIPPTIFKYKELSDLMPADLVTTYEMEYDQEAYDHSAMFKSDYTGEFDDENLDRMTTSVSANHRDMWSLKEIISNTGEEVKIDYESDSYNRVHLHEHMYPIHEIRNHEDPDKVEMKIISADYDGDLLDFFKAGAKVRLDLLFKVDFKQLRTCDEYEVIKDGSFYAHLAYKGNNEVAYDAIPLSGVNVDNGRLNDNVDERYIKLNSSELQEFINWTAEGGAGVDTSNPSNLGANFQPIVFPELLKKAIQRQMDNGVPNCETSEYRTIRYVGGGENPEVGSAGACRSIHYDLEDIVHVKMDFKLGLAKVNMNQGVTKNFPDDISRPVAIEKYGGNLRVKQITSENPITLVKKITKYDYSDPDLFHIDTNPIRNVSSGHLVYEAGAISPFDDDDFECVPDKTRDQFLNDISKSYSKLLNNARLLPAPNVVYERVAKQSYVKQLGDQEARPMPYYAVSEFNMFDEHMIQLDTGHLEKSEWENTYRDGRTRVRRKYYTKKNTVGIKNYLGQLGLLKSVTMYDSETDKPLTKSAYHYLHDDQTLQGAQNNPELYVQKYEEALAPFNYQGMIQEMFANSRYYEYENRYKRDRGTLFTRARSYYRSNIVNVISYLDEYPTIQLSETHTDFRVGSTKTIENIAFDMFSGEVIATKTKDGNGRQIVHETQPAYWHYPDMGLKLHNDATNDPRKHMLTQQSASTSFMLNDLGHKEKVLAASITTWGNEFDRIEEGIFRAKGTWEMFEKPVWRKKANYQYIGDYQSDREGFGVSIADFEAQVFLAFDDVRNPTRYIPWTEEDEAHPFVYIQDYKNSGPWIKNNEITLYDAYSHALEVKDEINEQYAATRMTHDQHRVLATASPSQYFEMAYSGAEEMLKFGKTTINGVTTGGIVIPSSKDSHSGMAHIETTGTAVAFSYTFDVPYEVNVPNQKYKAMVWCYFSGPAEEQWDNIFLKASDGETLEVIKKMSPKKNIKTYGSWHPIELIFEAIQGQKIKVTAENRSGWPVKFDDFRVQPRLSAMQAYVYDQRTGQLSYVLDNNNFYTQYKYDPMGRLTEVIKEINYYVPRFDQSTRYFNKFSENKN